jgi:hypothetical protein
MKERIITKEILMELLDAILVEVNDEWFSEKQIERLEKLVKYDINLLWKNLKELQSAGVGK